METIDDALTRNGFRIFQIVMTVILGNHYMCIAYQLLTCVLLGPILYSFWHITTIEIYLTSASSFIGVLIGSVLFGKFADVYGRRITLIIVDVGLILFTLNTAISPTIYWVIINQVICGIFTSGLCVSSFSIMSELMPQKVRGTLLSSMILFWCLASFIMVLFSMALMSMFNWRIFLLIVSIPMFIALISLIWLPESPRYLMLQDKKEKCIKAINSISKVNRSRIVGNLHNDSSNSYSCRDIVLHKYYSTTMLMIFMLFVACLTFCAIILMVAMINALPTQCKIYNLTVQNSTTDTSCNFFINPTKIHNILIYILAEFIFGIIIMILINIIGRKITLAICSLIICIGLIILNFCIGSIPLTILLFFIIGASSAFLVLNFVYLTEVFPTSVRALVLGIGGMAAIFGGLISFLIVYVLIIQYSFIGGTMLMLYFNIIAFIASYFLPHETKNRKLYQTAYIEDYVNDDDSNVTKLRDYKSFKNN